MIGPCIFPTQKLVLESVIMQYIHVIPWCIHNPQSRSCTVYINLYIWTEFWEQCTRHAWDCCINTSSSVTTLLDCTREGGSWNAAWLVTWPHDLCPACDLLLLSLIGGPVGSAEGKVAFLSPCRAPSAGSAFSSKQGFSLEVSFRSSMTGTETIVGLQKSFPRMDKMSSRRGLCGWRNNSCTLVIFF